ncbi:MAG TPA: HAD family hydrolase [Polyangiaceae bacterium]|nr:HAD family hydrolase [Polyangiaceae bacterium]
MIAVTFDYGQTLGQLDTAFLATRVAERGARTTSDALDRAMPAAWAAYDAAKHRGETGHDAWTTFMRTLLAGAGVTGAGEAATPRGLAEFLWSAQPTRNLWRRPIAGMAELVQELSERGVRLGIVSNSEGRLVELLEAMGLRRFFPVVADSGALGFEKPERRIFEWTAERLGVAPADIIHVGDAWVADVEGALAVGARAVWITSARGARELPPRVVACATAEDVRRALTAWGVP